MLSRSEGTERIAFSTARPNEYVFGIRSGEPCRISEMDVLDRHNGRISLVSPADFASLSDESTARSNEYLEPYLSPNRSSVFVLKGC